MAAGGGGAWKVAYADFVTAMMAFFLVMWIVAQSSKVKEAVAGYFRDPLGFEDASGTKGSGFMHDPMSEARARLPTALDQDRPPAESSPDKGKRPLVIALDSGDKTSVGSAVQFAEDSAELDAAARRRLSELAPKLRGKPNKIEIRGHATMRPLPAGSVYKDSWQLCYARCQATLKFLGEQGIEIERVRLSQAGPFEPSGQATESTANVRNSRVEVFLLGEYVQDRRRAHQEGHKPEGKGQKAEAAGHKAEAGSHKAEVAGHKAEH